MLELTKDFLDQLQSNIEAGRDVEIAATVGGLHPKDVADIFDTLKREEILYVYRLLESELKSEVIAELEEDVREELLSSLSSKEIAEDVIEGLDSDDAADALADLRDVPAILPGTGGARSGSTLSPHLPGVQHSRGRFVE